MNQAVETVVVLVGFVAIFGAMDFFEHRTQKGKHHHLKVLALVAALLCHPITVKTLENFAVHMVFFSGYVLKVGH